MSVHSLSTDHPEPEAERPMRADARRNRQRILEAAIAVFAECGSEAQIDDVARRADLGVGTIYRHFPTKEALLAELVRQKFRNLADGARGALEEDGEPFALLEALLRREGEMCAADATLQHALSGAGEREYAYASEEIEELYVLTAELLERARAAGTLRADIQPPDIGMLMCGVASTVTSCAPGFDWRRHLDLVIEALRAR
jgi:AcrR family transcriptional regulator